MIRATVPAIVTIRNEVQNSDVMRNEIDAFLSKLPEGRCNPCEYAKAVTANGGFIFLGCYHSPYRGKWVREIQKCPAKSEGEEK